VDTDNEESSYNNLNILDKIVADFNHSSSRFLFDQHKDSPFSKKPSSQQQLQQHLSSYRRSSMMPETFLDSNLFYPDLFESHLPSLEELASKRLSSQKKKYFTIRDIAATPQTHHRGDFRTMS
jgi:hypothetical protein